MVVLRTSGSDGYNAWLAKLGANSVTSIVISSKGGANSEFVRKSIANAEVVFIAGGDQSTYVKLWSGSSLQAAVNAGSRPAILLEGRAPDSPFSESLSILHSTSRPFPPR